MISVASAFTLAFREAQQIRLKICFKLEVECRAELFCSRFDVRRFQVFFDRRRLVSKRTTPHCRAEIAVEIGRVFISSFLFLCKKLHLVCLN